MISISSFARSHGAIDADDGSETQRSSLHPQLFHAVLGWVSRKTLRFFIPSVVSSRRKEESFVLLLYFFILDFLCVVCVCVCVD